MIGAVLALALIAPQIESEPFQLGRNIFYGGMCSTLGWVGDRDRAIVYGQAWARARPELSAGEAQNEMMRGMEAGRVDALALRDAFEGSGDAAKFRRELTERCDQVARDEPELLSRTGDTDQRLEAWITSRLSERDGE